jgi:hypothetical protein
MSLRLALPKFRKSGQPEWAAAAAAATSYGAEAGALPDLDAEEDTMTMRKRRAVRITVIVFVALAAGQYMQSARSNGGGGANAAASRVQSPLALNFGAGQEPRALLVPVELVANASAPSVSAGVSGRGDAHVVTISASPEDIVHMPHMPLQAAASACELALGLTVAPGAMLDLALSAPCHAGERVVLRHAGLAVTGQTDAAGTLAASLPALDAAGAVTVEFADGSDLRALAPVPELAGLRRMGVQWRAGDAFALHGLEDGAELQAAGDVSAENPGVMPDGTALPRGGWLVALGDTSVTAPLLAQVYTYPARDGITADVAILAQVGPDTCGHDMLGQTLASADGAVSVTDLTLSMPPCDGQTGYLVLKNLFPDMKIAASN